MGKLVVVESDPVEGTDVHNVSGKAQPPGGPPPPPVDFIGTGEYEYRGKMADALSDFVNVDGKPVAVVTSKSLLNPGEDSAGQHAGLNGTNFQPAAPNTPLPPTMSISDTVSEGTPTAGTGSSFVKAGGDALLLDGDGLDTCGSLKGVGNSTVTAEGQDFVSCSE